MIEYCSYEYVNGLFFNDTPEKAIAVFGEPELKSIEDSLEFYYPSKKKNSYAFKVIFDKNNKFSEFLLYPQTKARINGIDIHWSLDDILDIINLDSNPRMDDYDIILYDLGIVFGDFKPDYLKSNGSINLFRRGELDEFREDTEPFSKEKYLET